MPALGRVDPSLVDEDNDSKDDDGARGQSEAGDDEGDWELVVNPGSPRTTSRRSSLLPLATPSRVLEDLIHSALTSTKSVDPDELNNLLVAVELAAADEAEDGRGDLGDRRSSSSSSSSRADEAAEAATTVPERRAESENEEEEEEEEEDTGDPQAEPQQAPDVETYHHETKPLPDLPMTCGCCDDDVDFGAMVQCTQGHLFCPSCLSNYAAMNITEYRRTTFKCFSQEEVCDGTFTYAAVRQPRSRDLCTYPAHSPPLVPAPSYRPRRDRICSWSRLFPKSCGASTTISLRPLAPAASPTLSSARSVRTEVVPCGGSMQAAHFASQVADTCQECWARTIHGRRGRAAAIVDGADAVVPATSGQLYECTNPECGKVVGPCTTHRPSRSRAGAGVANCVERT